MEMKVKMIITQRSCDMHILLLFRFDKDPPSDKWHILVWHFFGSLVWKSSACPESITLPLQLHVPPLVPKRDDDGKIIIRPCSKE
jgi:hypothetical protein